MPNDQGKRCGAEHFVYGRCQKVEAHDGCHERARGNEWFGWATDEQAEQMRTAAFAPSAPREAL